MTWTCDCCLKEMGPLTIKVEYPFIDEEGDECFYTFCRSCFLENDAEPTPQWKCEEVLHK
jgi:hypothetical protein